MSDQWTVGNDDSASDAIESAADESSSDESMFWPYTVIGMGVLIAMKIIHNAYEVFTTNPAVREGTLAALVLGGKLLGLVVLAYLTGRATIFVLNRLAQWYDYWRAA